MADLDGDGVLDTAVSTPVSLYAGGDLAIAVRLSHAAGTGTFFVPALRPGTRIAAADVDLDHDLDLILVSGLQERIAVYLNDGQGGFTLDSSGKFLSVPASDSDILAKAHRGGFAPAWSLPQQSTDIACSGAAIALRAPPQSAAPRRSCPVLLSRLVCPLQSIRAP